MGPLRRLARRCMGRESPDHTLQTSALIHEAYLRLMGGGAANSCVSTWENRGHFFAAAAEAMRRILIDRARRKRRVRHGGELQRVDLEAVDPAASVEDDRLLALDQGQIIASGPPEILIHDPRVEEAYLGTHDAAGEEG